MSSKFTNFLLFYIYNKQLGSCPIISSVSSEIYAWKSTFLWKKCLAPQVQETSTIPTKGNVLLIKYGLTLSFGS